MKKNRVKKIQITPWQIKEEPHDKILQVTQNFIKYKNSPPISACFEDVKSESYSRNKVLKKEETHPQKARRQFSFHQKLPSNREELSLKPLSLEKYIEANKNLISSIKYVQTQKISINETYKQLAILKLIQSQLESERKNSQLVYIKEKYDCLFPLITVAKSKQKRLNQKSLNDILVKYI